MHSLTEISDIISEFLKVLQEKCDVNSLNAWHFTHLDKHFVQLSQTAAVNVYSVIYLSSQTLFLTVKEYKTVMKYEVIAEHEISTDQVTEIEERSFYLQAIVIFREDDYHYITLIERQKNILLQFNSDESLKINFDSDVNDWADDWVRIIMQQLLFAQAEDTTIVVFRLWDKKINTHKDKLLLRMLHTVKTAKKFDD